MTNSTISVVNLSEVLASLTRKTVLVEAATAAGVNAVAEAIHMEAIKRASMKTHAPGYKRPIGNGKFRYTNANPGEGPATVSGALKRSIEMRPAVVGFNAYEAVVSSGLVYSFQVEFGGNNWPEGVSYPYFRPAAEMVRPLSSAVFTRAYRAVAK
jgi:hypothetical protein